MGESRKREGIFGPYTEHTDDQGDNVGESRDQDGIFGPYTEHTDDRGHKTGESRERDGIFGPYTEHVDDHGNKAGESRERDGLFGKYTEHVDERGNKIGESRQRDGLFGKYTEHSGRGRREARRRDEEEDDDSSVWVLWLRKAAAVLFGIAMVFASWPIWLGMLLITAIVAVVLGLSLANGGWAVNLDERLGGRARLLAPGVAILIGATVIYGFGWGGSGTGNRILMTVVLLGSAVACWYFSGWVFGRVMRKAHGSS